MHSEELFSGYLRAQFQTASTAETALMAKAFAPCVETLRNRNMGILRLGLKGVSGCGKTPFASSLIGCFYKSTADYNFFNTLNLGHYKASSKPDCVHYDNAMLEAFMNSYPGQTFPQGNSNYEELQKFRATRSNAGIHVVEWPDLDEDRHYHCVWAFEHVVPEWDEMENAPRHISFYCPDPSVPVPSDFRIA